MSRLGLVRQPRQRRSLVCTSCGMLGNAEVLFVPRAACSATPKSCLFLGRHARQRRSLVCSSGGMLGNAEVLFVPRAACSATPKSCFFLGRYAQQRRSLVSSSGAHRIENILSSPARWFYLAQHLFS